jgi:hypothetical protein
MDPQILHFIAIFLKVVAKTYAIRIPEPKRTNGSPAYLSDRPHVASEDLNLGITDHCPKC